MKKKMNKKMVKIMMMTHLKKKMTPSLTLRRSSTTILPIVLLTEMVTLSLTLLMLIKFN